VLDRLERAQVGQQGLEVRVRHVPVDPPRHGRAQGARADVAGADGGDEGSARDRKTGPARLLPSLSARGILFAQERDGGLAERP
jgi:hypothetical protein